MYMRNVTKVSDWRTRYKIRGAKPEDKKVILAMTKNAFHGTRFYNDPYLDNDKCG